MNEIVRIIKVVEIMKAMTRQQLAVRAGVCRQTLNNWLKMHHQELFKLGMRPRCLLPPSVVEWILETYCIDRND